MNEGKRYTGFLKPMEERVENQKFYFRIKYNLINCYSFICIQSLIGRKHISKYIHFEKVQKAKEKIWTMGV